MIEYLLITDKHELLNHKPAIQKLFQECFNQNLDMNLWDWIYLKNICGSPIVSLCYDEKKKLIGHYAVVPGLFDREGMKIRSLLSMTTMVHKDSRKLGLFIKQAKLVYGEAKNMGYTFVYGFPNKNSAPGFKKRLGWNIDSNDYVALVTKEQMLMSKGFNCYVDNIVNSGVNVSDELYINWRLSKPNTTYTKKNNVILKKHGDAIDIVYISNGYYDDLEDSIKYNVLVDGSINDLLEYKVFEYQFGNLLLNDTLLGMDFKKDLLLSDVF